MPVRAALAKLFKSTMPPLLDKARYITLLLLFITLAATSSLAEDEFNFGDADIAHFQDSNVLPEREEVLHYLLFNVTDRVFFPHTEKGRPLFLTVIPCASRIEWTLLHEDKVLYKHTGGESHSLHYETGTPGLYSIDLKPLESDTYVKLYISDSFPLKTYPVLPNDNTVKIKKNSRKGFSVEWSKSPKETPFDNIIEYHIAVNRKRSFDTFCSLMSHLNGDKHPTQPDSFNFPKEKERFKKFVKKANPIKPAKKNAISYRKTNATVFNFNRARPGRKYFVNVYVYNKQTGLASAFESLVVRTKPGKRKTPSVKRLKNGQIQVHKFTKPKELLTMEFRVSKPAKEALLGVRVCGQKVRFQIRTKNKSWFSRKVQNYKEFTIKDLPKNTYTIKIRGPKRVGGEIKFTLTTKKNKYKFPSLPKKTSVTSLNITCENVTIAWIGETRRQTFCVYKTELSEAESGLRPKIDQCSSEIDKASEKVFCKRFRNHRQQHALQETVTGLKAGRHYRIDVTVIRKKSSKMFLRYDSLYVKTEETC